jgi:hypothetical protein
MRLEVRLAGPMVQTIFVRLVSIWRARMALAAPHATRLQTMAQSSSSSIGASSYFNRPMSA